MRILVDIVHIADVNFYKNAINLLKKQGHDVVLSVTRRGNLPEIVKNELGDAAIVGKHLKGGIATKIYSNLRRLIALRAFIKKTNPDIITSFSYYPAAAAFSKSICSVIFHDDPEYALNFKLCKIFAKKFVVPDFIPVKGKNIVKYHSYKEWAYLNPKYFKPNVSVLKKYRLQKDGYVFIREIAPVSLNYNKENRIAYSKIIPSMQRKGLKVVVSLEDKSRKDEFDGCIILEEPVKDFHSVVYYSLALVSSGDTMAREAALLGVPAFYTGKRKMIINNELIGQKLITMADDEDSLIEGLKNISIASKEASRKKMKSYSKSLDDATKVIVDEVIAP